MDEDVLFRALADPSRRLLLDGLPMSRQAASKHVAMLEAANLVATVRSGREKLHYLNPIPIQEIAVRWIGKFEARRVAAIVALKHKLEDDHEPDA